MFAEIKTFFETNALAIAAAKSIKDGREIEIQVTGSATPLTLTFKKEKGKNVILQESPKSADWTFFIPEKSMKEIVEGSFDSIGQIGLRLFEKILSERVDEKVRMKLHVGVLSLAMGGYFGVLTAGGSDVAKFLASKGLANMGKLKDTISKMKS